MRSKIIYSHFAMALTIILLAVLVICCTIAIQENIAFFTILSILLILVIIGILYGAIYIEVNNKYVILGSILKSKKFPIDSIYSVERFQPTMGAIRICASDGFMGYWGIFKERDIGRYYGFYGKASDCFLIRMKNGDKYLLGCENPDKMVEYIKSKI